MNMMVVNGKEIRGQYQVTIVRTRTDFDLLSQVGTTEVECHITLGPAAYRQMEALAPDHVGLIALEAAEILLVYEDDTDQKFYDVLEHCTVIKDVKRYDGDSEVLVVAQRLLVAKRV